MQTKTCNPNSTKQETQHPLTVAPFYSSQEGINSGDRDWLNKQFKRLPFMLYRSWLIITLLIFPIVQFLVIDSFLESFNNYIFETSENFAIGCIAMSMSFVFLELGSIDMLFAMWKKKSSTAQESFLKFQYSLIGSFIGFLFMLNGSFKIFSHYPEAEIFVLLALLITPIAHIVGGLYVLRMFKQNHPLVRQEISEETDQLSKEFLEQNVAIRSEILKYDDQLNRWPYLIYKIWLKFFVVLEIIKICLYIIYETAFIVQNEGIAKPWELIGIAFYVILSFLSVWSSFKVEVILRTKTLADSNRVIFLLTGSLLVVIVIFLFTVVENLFDIPNLTNVAPYFYAFWLWIITSIFAPIPTIIGAIKIKNIIQQRENLVGYSNYAHDSYL